MIRPALPEVERLFWEWLELLGEGTDEEIQDAADEFFGELVIVDFPGPGHLPAEN